MNIVSTVLYYKLKMPSILMLIMILHSIHRTSVKTTITFNDNDVVLDLETPLTQVSDQFLSVALGIGALESKWHNLVLSSPLLLNLARALAPAVLRVGGRREDFILFNRTSQPQIPRIETDSIALNGHSLGLMSRTNVGFGGPIPDSNYTMNSTKWDFINKFVTSVGWDLVFGLNVFLRENGAWNSSNAEQLMRYSKMKGYDVSWELGNEPNVFWRKFSKDIPPEQLARDFQTLKALTRRLKLFPKFIAGPDIGSKLGGTYFEKFLKSVTDGAVNAITWHHYYIGSAKVTLPDMFSARLLDTFIVKAQKVQQMVQSTLPNSELWLGETASCFANGGSQIFSSAYVAGFMWLDKLGLAAVFNHSRVMRQQFIGGGYGLIDIKFNPRPDYWLSVLYKTLVGTKVLNVERSTHKGRRVRVYAHCARPQMYSPGDIVLLILNTNTFDTTASLKTSSLVNAQRDVYWLTPPGNTANVLSMQVTLNGKLLTLVDNTTLPDLVPDRQEPSDIIKLPALSFGFYVFKDVKATACI